MCHDTRECVSLILHQSARLTRINADKLSPKGNANLCCDLLSALSCMNAANASSSVQGTLTCCCNACKFSLSGFMFLTTSCNICNCFRTVGLQIWKEIHPRPNKSTSSKLKSSHPFLKIHRTSVVFHELHESIQDHCLRSLDEMWSQESFEIARAVIWVSQQLSVQ